MLIDLTTSEITLDPVRFAGAIVVLVSDSPLAIGMVERITGIFDKKRDEQMPLMVRAAPSGAMYRAYALAPGAYGGTFDATSHMEYHRDSRKRVAQIVYHSTKFLTMAITRNDPKSEAPNHVLKIASDYDHNRLPPYITWETLGKQ